MAINAINSFINQYSGRSYFSYNFLYFSGSTAIDLINDGNNQNPIFGDINALKSALDSFSKVQASGATPYVAAIDLIAKAINNANLGKSGFAIVFISDGVPTDFGAVFNNNSVITYLRTTFASLGSNFLTFNTVFADQFNAQTASDTAAKTGVQLSELFDANAPILLQQMAAQFGGGFYDSSLSGTTFTLDQFVKLPPWNCF